MFFLKIYLLQMWQINSLIDLSVLFIHLNMCLFKSLLNVNPLLHFSQENCFNLRCIRIQWLVKWCFLKNPLPHISHLKTFSATVDSCKDAFISLSAAPCCSTCLSLSAVNKEIYCRIFFNITSQTPNCCGNPRQQTNWTF